MSATNTQSLLAKLLATENITVQHTPGIKTAMFDLKNRILMMPLWNNISKDLEDLLLGHETGHAIDTPIDDYKKGVETITANVFPNEKISEKLQSTVRGFLNVIEDARIDKRQKRRYPGLRKNYLIGYKELMDRDFFGTAKRDINSMTFIDRLNIYFKGGSIHYNLEFSPVEKVFLNRVENLETFPETVALTEEIYRFCKEELEKQQEMSNDLLSDDIELGEEGDDYNDDNDSFDYNDDDFGDEGQDAEDEGDSDSSEGKGQSDSLTGEGDIQSESASSNGAGAGPGDEKLPDNTPRSETDETWERKVQELVKDENAEYIYLNFPDVDWEKAVNDYKIVLNDWRTEHAKGYYNKETYNYSKKEFLEWKVKEKDSISFMVKEFEQRKAAELYARINIAKTGVIDTNKLHSYKYNDDIFRRLTVIPNGKNHGFVMFLDWSGSMSYGLNNTMKQLFSLILFCKQIQVPFEVYAFKDSSVAGTPFTDTQINTIKCGTVVLRNFISSKMNITELNDAMTYLWYFSQPSGRSYSDSLGGTPLNEAIAIAPKVINDFRAKYKLEIVNTIFLTDGDANGFGGVSNETFSGSHWQKRRRFFYTDKATGKTIDIDPYGWGNTSSNTSNLLKLLKEKTGSNLVGFFLMSESFNWFSRRFNLNYGSADYLAKVRKFYNENKFYPIKSEGYDEYYVINSSALRETKNDLEINSKGTTRSMAKAFSKFAQKKTVNRVLLRNFIEKITGQAKKVA